MSDYGDAFRTATDAYATQNNSFWESANNAYKLGQQRAQDQRDALARQAGAAALQANPGSAGYGAAARAYAGQGDFTSAVNAANLETNQRTNETAMATQDAAQRQQHAQLMLKATQGIREYVDNHPGTTPQDALTAVQPIISTMGTPAEVAQFGQAFSANPQQTLDAAEAFAQRELQIVPGANGAYSAVDKATGERTGGYTPAVPGKIEHYPTTDNVIRSPDQPERYEGSAAPDGQATPAVAAGAPAAAPAPGATMQPSRPGRLDPHAFFTEFVAPHEGGLNPHDANGSPTNMGINQAANPGVDVHNLTRAQAADIFATKYFGPSGSANLPAGLAAVNADTAFINPSRAQQFLQQSGGDPQKYMDLRDAWMSHLVQTDPARYGPYAHAWATRNRDLRAYATRADAGGTAAAPPAPPQDGQPTAAGGNLPAGYTMIQAGTAKPTGHASTPAEIRAAGLPEGTAAWTDANGKPTPYARDFQPPPQPGPNSGLTGDAYLKTLPPGYARTVQAIANGDAPLPPIRTPYGQKLQEDVFQYDPTASAANLPSRVATRRSATSGPISQDAKSLSTSIGHLGRLSDAIDGLGNYGLPLNNMIAHGIAGATGTDARIQRFESDKQAVITEVARAFQGGVPPVGEISSWEKRLDHAANPETLHVVTKEIAELLRSRLQALGNQYSTGMGRTEDPLQLISPEAQTTWGRLSGDHTSQAEAVPAAAQRQAGHVYQTPKGPYRWTGQGWAKP